MATKKTEKAKEEALPVSSLAPLKTKKPELAFLELTAELDGKTYSPLVPSLNHEGTVYTASEFMAKPDVLKFLVTETFNRAGVSTYIKEVF